MVGSALVKILTHMGRLAVLCSDKSVSFSESSTKESCHWKMENERTLGGQKVTGANIFPVIPGLCDESGALLPTVLAEGLDRANQLPDQSLRPK